MLRSIIRRLDITFLILAFLSAAALPAGAQQVSSLACAPLVIGGGSGGTATCTVALGTVAPAGGTEVTIGSALPGLAAAVPTILVPAGQTTGTFTVSTNPRYRRYSGLAFSAAISATAGGASRSVTLSVTAQARPTDLVANPDTDLSGLSCAGEAGVLFTCSGSTCSFRQECALGCERRPISGANWQDRCFGSGPFPLSLSPATIVGGRSATATVALGSGAPAGATANVVSNSLFAQSATGQSTSIATGAVSKTFSVRSAPVGRVEFAPIDVLIARPAATSGGGTFIGTQAARTWLAVAPGLAPAPAIVSLDLDPSTIRGGLFTSGRACIDQLRPAPDHPFTPFSITSSHPGLVTIGSISHPQGADCAVFGAQTAAVSATTVVTITAMLGSASRTTQLTLTGSTTGPTLAGMTVSPATLIGGAAATGTVTLSAPATTGGASVALTSSVPAVTIPAAVVVPEGATSAGFPVATSSVAVATFAVLTGVHGGVVRSTSLTVNPPQGSSAALTVTATGRSGERVTSTPVGINVPVGSTGSANFTVGTTVTLTASNGRDATWSGACSSGGVRQRSCTFTLNGPASVTANIR